MGVSSFEFCAKPGALIMSAMRPTPQKYFRMVVMLQNRNPSGHWRSRKAFR
jgi:hypothetical protein